MELKSAKIRGFWLQKRAKNPRLKVLKVLKLKRMLDMCGLKASSIKTRIETRIARSFRSSRGSLKASSIKTRIETRYMLPAFNGDHWRLKASSIKTRIETEETGRLIRMNAWFESKFH